MEGIWTNQQLYKKRKKRCIKTFVMQLRRASAPPFSNRVPDERAVQGLSPSKGFVFFIIIIIRPLLSWLSYLLFSLSILLYPVRH